MPDLSNPDPMGKYMQDDTKSDASETDTVNIHFTLQGRDLEILKMEAISRGVEISRMAKILFLKGLRAERSGKGVRVSDIIREEH